MEITKSQSEILRALRKAADQTIHFDDMRELLSVSDPDALKSDWEYLEKYELVEMIRISHGSSKPEIGEIGSINITQEGLRKLQEFDLQK